MSTHDYVIANQNGANTRSDLNNAFSAIVSNNSSASEPSTTYAYMWWADTANDLLKQRNAADSAWISILTLSTGEVLNGSSFGDNVKAKFGASDDLQIYHDGTVNHIGGITEDASGNVGIGTSTLYGKTTIEHGTGINNGLTLSVSDATANGNITGIQFSTNSVVSRPRAAIYSESVDSQGIAGWGADLVFATRSAPDSSTISTADERLRIDSNGAVLVGTTSYAPTTTSGIIFGTNNKLHATRASGASGYFNRLTTDGTIVEFAKDGSTVGVVGSVYFGATTGLYITSETGTGLQVGWRFDSDANQITPCQSNGATRDNAIDLGSSANRMDDIYATNGTIQTSDRNEKQDIEELSEAEQRVAIACKGLLRKFRWQDAVAEKGDDARIHFGIIAQDLQDAFTAEGLDAGRYAMFISTTWYEKQTPVDAVEAVEAVEATYDDEGNELTPAVEAVEAKDAYIRTDTEEEPTEGYTERTRLGVRYPELLAFIISAI